MTRLDSTGSPVAGPNNVYVTDASIQLSVKPQIQAGEDKVLVGGCDCIIASYRGYDKLKRFDLELDLGKIQPGLIEMLTGSTAILDGVDPIGVWWPNDLTCDGTIQPNVCIEGWQTLWTDDHPEASPHQYVHWIWPSSFWQISDHTLQNDFLQPKLTGFTRANPNWGLGIFGEQPEAAGDLGGFFYVDAMPTASCGYQTFAIT